MPDVYIDFILCKTFGWTPDQLDDQDTSILNSFLQIISYENEAKEFEMKKTVRKYGR